MYTYILHCRIHAVKPKKKRKGELTGPAANDSHSSEQAVKKKSLESTSAHTNGGDHDRGDADDEEGANKEGFLFGQVKSPEWRICALMCNTTKYAYTDT
jgi:hypothetical protein